jgi:hypothetical protein
VKGRVYIYGAELSDKREDERESGRENYRRSREHMQREQCCLFNSQTIRHDIKIARLHTHKLLIHAI